MAESAVAIVETDSERAALDCAARLVLGGQLPGACRLARALHRPYAATRAVVLGLFTRGAWPYAFFPAGCPGPRRYCINDADRAAARDRLGPSAPSPPRRRGVRVARPRTRSGRACARYRIEHRDGVNFLELLTLFGVHDAD